MDYKVIINLMKEMNHTDLTKLEINEEKIHICIEKTATIQPVPAAPANAAFAGNSLASKPEEQNYRKLLSPMVGTFFAQSSPDKPPFVKVGDKVKKGQTVCIIEAMKLMNEIESEHDGEIVKILTQNEEMVEYGQPLFLIK